MRTWLFLLSIVAPIFVFGQVHRSVIQDQHEHYRKFRYENDSLWDVLNGRKKTHATSSEKTSICTLNKKVYGWHPYWNGTTYQNYDWSNLSHLCYFSYEVNPSTGNDQSGTTTPAHNFSTAAAVTTALNNNVKVTLCATLFSGHSTLWASSTAQTTLINNLISMVQARGAHGVNIDFEGMGSADKTPFKNFMVNLCTQMHAAIPGSEVSIALYSVDWSTAFDIPGMNSYVDNFIIMGYDYYYGGSTTAGPTDPLYNFQTSYNYTLTKSITYYLKQGVTASKLLLGLPYYGREWQTTAGTVPSSTVSGGYSGTRTYKYVRDNSATYSTRQWDANSYTPYYVYQTSGQWRQCFIDDAYSMGKRFDVVNQQGLGGIGIWALGYDDGYSELWNKIEEKFSSCKVVTCTDTIFDMGGPNRNYYDNENYTYTISPSGSNVVSLTFSSFSLGAGDTLWLYNGASTASPLFGTYTGSTSPGTVTGSGNNITVKFKSNASTTGAGYVATWACTYDNVAPSTAISNPPAWATQSFTTTFTDADNSGGTGIEKSFYQVLEYTGTEWRANASNGFFNDNFDIAIHPDWTQASGIWGINTSFLEQTDEANSNTNIYTPVTQNLSNRYLYQWQAKITGTGTNRRAGLHFFSDNASLSNRGNSYFVWFRLDNQQLQFYKVVNDTFTLKNTVTVNLSAGTYYDFKVFYDRTTGVMEVYVNNAFVGSWTDPSPYTNGSYISLRSGNCIYTVNDLKVYRSRSSSALIKVGSASTNDIRYQNPSPATPSGRIKSITKDVAGNLSPIVSKDVNVDWTIPVLQGVYDNATSSTGGVDYDTTTIGNSISASWNFTDPNSGIYGYRYFVGTSPGDSDVVSPTVTGLNSFNETGVTLQNNTWYYVTVSAINNATLKNTITSDGIFYYVAPVATFNSPPAICAGNSIVFANNSSGATSYQWNCPGGLPSTSTASSPMIQYSAAGTYTATLTAINAGITDTAYHTVIVNTNPSGSFSGNDTSVNLPASTVNFTSNVTNANTYLWNFGDGGTSTFANPSHTYTTTGEYSVSLQLTSSAGCSTLVSMTNYVHVYGPTGIAELNDGNIQLIPNPASSVVTIISAVSGRVEIRDLQGKICINDDVQGRRSIDISSLSSGLYNVIFVSENGIENQRLQIVR
jgi:spore germination protein YaaH/PKD repeat protein